MRAKNLRIVLHIDVGRKRSQSIFSFIIQPRGQAIRTIFVDFPCTIAHEFYIQMNDTIYTFIYPHHEVPRGFYA